MATWANQTKYKVIDSYPESNQDSSTNLRSSTSALKVAQTSIVTGGFKPTSAVFYLEKVGSPTGNAYAKIYATSGGAPTGSALITSDAYVVSALSTTSFALVTFNFRNNLLLSAGTYALSYEPDDLVAGTNTKYGTDITSPTHAGTQYIYNGTTWSSQAGDVIFYLYGEPAPTGLTKNTFTPSNISKNGKPWTYGQSGYGYGQSTDPVTLSPVMYGSGGTELLITNVTKN